MDEAAGNGVNLTPGLEKLTSGLIAIAPEDANFIKSFVAGVRSMQKTDIFKLMETPVELLGPFGPLKQLWHLRRSLRYLGGAYNKPLIEFTQAIKNASVRRMFTHLFLPEMPAWFMLFLLALLANRQMGLIEG